LGETSEDQHGQGPRLDGIAIAELKAEGKCPQAPAHRQVKYLDNIVETDHGKLKRLIKPALGFKSMKTAYATLKDFEVMHALRKGHVHPWQYEDGIMGEAHLVNRQFGRPKQISAPHVSQQNPMRHQSFSLAKRFSTLWRWR